MKLNNNIATKIKQFFAVLMIGGLVSFADSEQENKLCKDVVIEIANADQYKFVDQQSVLDILTERGKEHLLNKKMGEIDLKYFERKLKKDQFVKNAQVYKGLDGRLMVSLEQASPIARVIKGSKSFYIGLDGDMFSTTRRFSARVSIISVDRRSSLFRGDSLQSDQDVKMLEFLQYVTKDSFFSKQLSQFYISKDNEIEIYPQITKQTILFGDVKNYQEKMKRLLVFYKKVLPTKGWNKYTKVNVKYKDQIICE